MVERRRRRSGSAAILGCAILGSALLGACADNSSAAGTGSGGLTTLRVGLTSNAIAYFPVFVAQKEGYFKAEKLNIAKPVLLGTGSKLGAAVVGGSVDVAGGVVTDTLGLAKAGRTPVVISDLFNAYFVDIVVGKKFKIPPNATPMQKIQALKGKTIGTSGPGSGTAALVTYLTKLGGLTPNTDIKQVTDPPSLPGALNALKAGKYDAVAIAQPAGEQAEQNGIGTIYISPSRGDIPQMMGQVHGVLYTTPAALKSHKAAMQAFVRAIAKAETYIHQNASGTSALYNQYTSGLSAASLRQVVQVLQKDVPATPVMPQAGYKTAVDFHLTSGLQTSAPTYAQLTGDNFAQSALGS
jgi:NitT/TauT family transport system substrate-binding protein